MRCDMGSVRDALGPEVFDVAVAEGRELSLSDAAQYAARGMRWMPSGLCCVFSKVPPIEVSSTTFEGDGPNSSLLAGFLSV